MNRKVLDIFVGLGTAAILAFLVVRLILGYSLVPGEEPGALEGVLGIEAAPVVDRPMEHPKQVAWSFDGFTGTFDKASARRGLQVYREVCSACHGLSLVSFRTLTALGYSEDAALEVAQGYQIDDGPDEFGDMFMRAGRLSDYFPSPFPNKKAAAAANGGKAPPDLSLIAKAREDGPNYVYSLLTGYTDPPGDFVANSEVATYNPYFPGWEIVMPPPLYDGQVTFEDGTEASVEQMARDVVQFLMWTAEPKLEARHEMGLKVVIYMLVLTLLLFLSMRLIWRRVKE